MRLLPALLVTVVPALAHADRIKSPANAQLYDLVATDSNAQNLRFARQVLPATNDAGLVAQSRVIYLNKNGATLYPGENDARTNRSTIANQPTQIPAWNVNPTVWADTVACVRELFAPFDVTVVETDPGNVPHIEAIFGGSPTQLGMSNNVAGVSPFTTDCSIIENSIVFTFTNVIPQDARLACEIQAQEIAHSFGLDHEMLASDPMTYLDYNGNRSFKNQTASCGEYSNRLCGIAGSVCRQNQNSVALLTERLGAADAVAPTVAISAPLDGAVVEPGFRVTATATDNVAVVGATLYIDDTEIETLATAPFTFTTPASLAEGPHQIRIEATDGSNSQTSEITVTVREAPSGGGGGDGDGDGDGDGNGGGNGGGNGNGNGGTDPSDVTGGCSTGGMASPLALLALATRLRRRRRT